MICTLYLTTKKYTIHQKHKKRVKNYYNKGQGKLTTINYCHRQLTKTTINYRHRQLTKTSIKYCHRQLLITVTDNY